MEVLYLDCLTWEPLSLRFELSRNASFDTKRFEKRVVARFNAPRKSCTCRFIQSSGKWESEYDYLFQIEWACRVCLDLILEQIANEFDFIRRIEIGLRQGHQLAKAIQSDLIEIRPQEIEFEDGLNCIVEKFQIQKTPIKVGQFQAFADKTGYRSVAERKKSDETYRYNQTLSGAGASERLNRYACFLAAADAFAFCNHYKVRLPTEAEWLSAAVYDWREYDLDDPEAAIAVAMRQRPSNAIRVIAFDFTSTVQNGQVIARRGPVGFLEKKWRTRNNRESLKFDDFSIETGFRIAV